MKRALWPHVFTPAEINALDNLSDNEARWRAAATFGAKEAIYKSLASLGDDPVPGFHDVELAWDHRGGFTIRPAPDTGVPPHLHLQALRGRAADVQDRLLALVWLE